MAYNESEIPELELEDPTKHEPKTSAERKKPGPSKARTMIFGASSAVKKGQASGRPDDIVADDLWQAVDAADAGGEELRETAQGMPRGRVGGGNHRTQLGMPALSMQKRPVKPEGKPVAPRRPDKASPNPALMKTEVLHGQPREAPAKGAEAPETPSSGPGDPIIDVFSESKSASGSKERFVMSMASDGITADDLVSEPPTMNLELDSDDVRLEETPIESASATRAAGGSTEGREAPLVAPLGEAGEEKPSEVPGTAAAVSSAEPGGGSGVEVDASLWSAPPDPYAAPTGRPQLRRIIVAGAILGIGVGAALALLTRSQSDPPAAGQPRAEQAVSGAAREGAPAAQRRPRTVPVISVPSKPAPTSAKSKTEAASAGAGNNPRSAPETAAASLETAASVASGAPAAAAKEAGETASVSEAAPSPREAADDATPAEARSAREGVAAPGEDAVRITLNGVPRRASIFVDRQPSGRVFTVPRSDESVKIEVKLAGFPTVVKRVVPSVDKQIRIKMRPE